MEMYDARELIEWIAFGPPGQFVAVTPTHAHVSNPDMVRTFQKDGETYQIPLRCASFGCNGAWVVVEEDGQIRSTGLPKATMQALTERPVRVSLKVPENLFGPC